MNCVLAIRGTTGSPSPARPWLRHAVAAVVSLALNAILLIGLAWGSSATERAAATRLLAKPLRVVDVPREHPKSEPTEREVVARIEAPQPTLPALPQVQRVSFPPLEPNGVTLEPLALRVPEFAPQTVSLIASSLAPPEAPGSLEPSGPASATRNAVLVQPPDLSLYYPYRARVRELTGTTRLQLRVDASGTVTAVEVLSSSPVGVFESAARRVGRALRFQPALDQGRSIPSEVSIAIQWRLPE